MKTNRRLQIEAALTALAVGAACLPTHASAQVSLSAYTDKNGYIDVQALTCGQLAGTWQEDADYLAAWYSGWYNGLAKRHFAHVARVKSGEHALIVYCKAHQNQKVIQAIDVLLKEEAKAQYAIGARCRSDRLIDH